MQVSKPVAITVIVIVVLVAAVFIWRGTSGGNYGKPPPIVSGLSGPATQGNRAGVPAGPGTGAGVPGGPTPGVPGAPAPGVPGGGR